jgi:hypothetical protein
MVCNSRAIADLMTIFSAVAEYELKDPVKKNKPAPQRERAVEIAVDLDGDARICCHHVMAFWENYLLIPFRNEPNYSELTEQAIRDALADNCESYINPLRGSKIPGHRSIADEFDKCMRGEAFDFTPAYISAIQDGQNQAN